MGGRATRDDKPRSSDPTRGLEAPQAGAPGLGTLDAPGMVGFEGVAGGPIGAEPEPVPSFLGSSAPGAFVPG